MKQALAEVLADIDDPDLVEQVLDEVRDDQSQRTQLSGSSPGKSLEEWYETYLKRRQNRSPSTRAQYKRTIPTFLEFSEKYEAVHPSELRSSIVEDYIDMLLNEYDSDSTILTYTKNVRTWLKWVSKREAVDDSLYALLDRDELGLSPNARDEAIPTCEAKHLLSRLNQQRRGSANHAILALLWNGGLRIGDVHSLNLDDFDTHKNEITIRHRPEQDTRLKNKDADSDTAGNGERNVGLNAETVDVLQQYIQTTRPDVRDEYHNRDPLFSTPYGRASRSTLRRWVYEATSCRWAADGPVEITCDGSCDPDSNVCTHSYYPHAVRRGCIVAHLSAGLRQDRAAGRFDVSVPVLKRHYDPRTLQQRKADREDAVQEAWSNI